MTKTATIRARIEPDLKNDVEKLFKTLGLSTTEAINLFYRQVKLRQGLPFSIAIPNKTTEQVFKDTDNKLNLISCNDAEDMFDKLGPQMLRPLYTKQFEKDWKRQHKRGKTKEKLLLVLNMLINKTFKKYFKDPNGFDLPA